MKKENEYIEDILFGYFTGDLSEAQEKELLQWLEADESNKEILSKMADWWAMAHVPLFVSDMKPDFEKHFGNLKKTSSLTVYRQKINLLGKIVASVLLLIAVGSLSYFIGKYDVNNNNKIAYFETVVPMGSCSKVILPDQSVVWLNAGSSLKYSGAFNKANREIFLNGEAYFEVKRDSLKPFVVKSEVLDIQVLGTCFNVKAYQNEPVTDVALVSGKVNIHLNRKFSTSGEVVLFPNRMLSFNKKTNRAKVMEIKGEDAYTWKDGILKFTEQPFDRIARDLERKYDVSIHINSESLKKEVFSGSFSSDYSLSEILNEVDMDKKYTWKRNGHEIMIYDK